MIPNSAGTRAPRLAAPPGAADCHIHVYDPRYPLQRPDARAVSDAGVEQYRLLQQRLGTTHVVVVQPAAHGTDNRVTMDAVAALGGARRACGIAVVTADVSDDQLRALDAGGIRGLRFTQHDPRTAITTPGMIEPLARRIQEFGWHVQLHLLAAQIVALRSIIERLPGTVVIDHMARLPQPEGAAHPAWDIVKRLLDRGRAWVKLSGAYLDSRVGGPGYGDVLPVARAFVQAAPERCVWGSDWPHPTERATKPDDAVLFDVLAEWAGTEERRRAILVDNPCNLYRFART